jgi:HAD superfamily hydrolase (TIGR01509 family)
VEQVTGYRGLLVDMDGVVLDSESVHDAAKELLFAELGVDVPADVWPTFKGRANHDVYTIIARDYGGGRVTADELMAGKERHMAALSDRLQLVDGALETLRSAHEAGVPACLVTSSTRRAQAEAFALFELTHLFAAVVTSDDVDRFKPHPLPYATGARLLGLPPSACVAIEDSANGVRSAKAAGARVVGLTGTFEADVLHDAGADRVCASHADVRRVLALEGVVR